MKYKSRCNFPKVSNFSNQEFLFGPKRAEPLRTWRKIVVQKKKSKVKILPKREKGSRTDSLSLQGVVSFESWSRKVKVKALSTICTRYGYNFTLPRVSFSLCPLPPTLLSSLSPFLLLFPPVIFPFFFFLFFIFFFLLFRPLILFLEGRMGSIEADRWFVYPLLFNRTGASSPFIRRFLFTVYAMVNLLGDVGMTRLLGRYTSCNLFLF